jgi:MFS family permease
VSTAYCLNFPISVFASMWIGIGASTVQDLVLPRMRAVASAFYLLVITFVGFALGPYCIGALSDALGDLAAAMRFSLLANLVAAGLLWRALHTLPRDESTLRARARAAGEPGL